MASSPQTYDNIIIGSGMGGLTTAALLAQAGQRTLLCESHSIAGGAAHSFKRDGFTFDSGPSFYCGLADPHSCNPLTQVLAQLGETLEAVPYDPLGHYHFPDRTIPIYCKLKDYRAALAEVTPKGAEEFQRFEQKMLHLYRGLEGLPLTELRGDWKLFPMLMSRYPQEMLKLGTRLPLVQASVGKIMDATIQDPWVRRLIDLECFLLSGLKAHGTVAPEVAFMLGERDTTPIDYPIGGSGAIVDALVRAFERHGGELRLSSHVAQIQLDQRKATGVVLKSGEEIQARRVISNATLWDTYGQLLPKGSLAPSYQEAQEATPVVESFMHLHLGIRADGLERLTGHHVVVHDDQLDVTTPGNTCMISIPSVWDSALAPAGHHVVHSYTLEPFEGWTRDGDYEAKKQAKAETLYRALERVIPDIRDRITTNLVGTPLTHARYLRRHKGTYGPAIAAGQGHFPSPKTPIKNLYRVGDSTLPGIGVPAVVASGIMCANMLKD